MIRRFDCLPLAALAALNVFTGAAWAHPGHGVTPADEPVHWIVEPIHGWPILLAVGVAVLIWRRNRSRA